MAGATRATMMTNLDPKAEAADQDEVQHTTISDNGRATTSRATIEEVMADPQAVTLPPTRAELHRLTRTSTRFNTAGGE